jgi:XTP/dITP diphosphohydrolase
LRLVLASSNSGKLRELTALLRGLPYEAVTQASLGIEPIDETGASFQENALLKARHAAVRAGGAALADDSGLEVDALGGAPGVRSARYAGLPSNDAANNRKLMAELEAIDPALRHAQYRCVLAYVRAPNDVQPIVVHAAWRGMIIDAPRGDNGFGYDPYFFLPELGLTVAELDTASKNRLSHRGQALRALRAELESAP